MNESEIINILNELGMTENDISSLPNTLVGVINFVDELCLYNDLETIKKFLTILFYKTKGEQK